MFCWWGGVCMTTETMKQIKEMIDINLKVKLENKAEKEGLTYEGLIRKTLFECVEK